MMKALEIRSAGPELRSKLLRRLSLQKELEDGSWVNAPTGSPEKCVVTLKEGDKQRRWLSLSMAQDMVSGTEVASLRSDIEMLRRDLTDFHFEKLQLHPSTPRTTASEFDDTESEADDARRSLEERLAHSIMENQLLREKVSSLETEVVCRVAEKCHYHSKLRQASARRAKVQKRAYTAKIRLEKLRRAMVASPVTQGSTSVPRQKRVLRSRSAMARFFALIFLTLPSMYLNFCPEYSAMFRRLFAGQCLKTETPLLQRQELNLSGRQYARCALHRILARQQRPVRR